MNNDQINYNNDGNNNYQVSNNINNGMQPNSGQVNNGLNNYQNQPVNNSQNSYNNQNISNYNEKEENVVLGSIGALVGSLLGGVSIYLFLSINFVASLSGVLIAICALYGYELLGHKISKKGIIISSVIMAISVYVCYRASLAIKLTKLTNISFLEAFRDFPTLVRQSEAQSDYYLTLFELFAFCAIGAFGVIKAKMKKNKIN